MTHWPEDVGILACEVYIPYLFVEQEKLETFDGVKGKYTIGLGQKRMGFCGDQEDINSLCLTVVQNLMDKQNIDPKDVGRMEVGTETIIDHSKSVKTVLMQLFEESGNTNIEGVDTTNACYGGTSALFNAVNWIESSSWDGRLAIVVIADIGVYAAGNARCTGGGGAIALVLGPNAPIVFDRGLKATHMMHAYDFYKPKLASEYPIVDSQLSVKSYLSALDKCYQAYGSKFSKFSGQENLFSLDCIDYMVFHTPYCKLIEKSIGRCMLNDFMNAGNNNTLMPQYSLLEKYRDFTLDKTFDDPLVFKEIERTSVQCSKSIYEAKTKPSTLLATNIGNMYTASLYGSLVSLLISMNSNDLIKKRVVLFSYGSGLASSMFSVTLCPNEKLLPKFHALIDSLKNIRVMLDCRKEVEPKKFVEILEIREKYHNACNYEPSCSSGDLFPGSFFLKRVDEKYRRYYGRNEVLMNGKEH
ncbi:hydroxymethylglutaryl-CoA synthase 1-like [Hydractinia symbiolongicarpus]|uniref:hydroxymethylglutaryl-CoA synthase 1-like n=1 Tax=Hydractinia symbiolongicarpus TaxID=13093 RepID=UPI0025508E9A|nr:hydroxymethylglutaryl-CoA synthase 1-like [Hydractinia symbiolongicarpus]